MKKLSCFRFLLFGIGAIIVSGCARKKSEAVSVAVVVQGNSNDVQVVQSDVSRLLKAVYASDVDTVLDLTHTKTIEIMGGKAQAQTALKDALQQIQMAGMKLESFDFPKDPTYLRSDVRQFAIVPTKSLIVAHGQRIESLNYQFGVKEAGASNWTYIEGSRINSSNANNIFPDFPVNFQFPDFYRKKL